MPRALISVSDKRGIVPFARGLVDLGWEIISTGGTSAALKNAGVPVTPVDQVTGFPEILDGRVKTLHPAIHAGLLARRDHPEHQAALAQHHITPIDLVAVNLYPFQATIAKPDVTFEDAIENIDIGGPSMLRSAAKNHTHVLVIVDPADYTTVLDLLRQGEVSPAFRRQLAAKVFTHAADYDGAIASFLSPREEGLPSHLNVSLKRAQVLRYGENPGQRAGLYVTEEPRGIGDLKQRHGKELSFNNILDLDAAMSAASLWQNQPACVIIKHTTPCGIALGQSPEAAFTRALATDPQSAFGGVVAFNTVVDRATAEAMRDIFLEVVAAPSFHDDALEVFGARKNLRIVELPVGQDGRGLDFKTVRGGFLVQDRFRFDRTDSGWQVVTARKPTTEEMRDLVFAWCAVAAVKSNAVLLARDEMAIGIGAGQMSRVDSSFLAVHKARQQGHDPRGSVMASDGFFPFADGVDEAAAAGVTAIIQPGGSVRDPDVIAAADKHGMAMIITGKRQFRH
ncbi:MAG TPA: bifunctional phosphoribosylaminoimidazolecarboxamide formyltransferase/IMP cyclohydrolase [Gemmatimonadales bacterium]|jgi:phosphoribosylaminoimidazolecarboxamide formyltransferase/IMP cyclohydrolase|nr:bifunctional phosphoribosylaminoimidazolecarboxamide formyltransferase/IMP cyclohydrolase [Gemmatimonadales bacterium]